MYPRASPWIHRCPAFGGLSPHHAAQLFLTSGPCPETPTVGGRNYPFFSNKKSHSLRCPGCEWHSSFSCQPAGACLAAQVTHHLLGLELDHPSSSALTILRSSSGNWGTASNCRRRSSDGPRSCSSSSKKSVLVCRVWRSCAAWPRMAGPVQTRTS